MTNVPFLIWTCGGLAVFYCVGLTVRGFARIYRGEPAWRWLRD